MKQITQQKIAGFFKVSQPFISAIKREEKKITWEMAAILSEISPEKSAREWKKVSYKKLAKTVGILSEKGVAA